MHRIIWRSWSSLEAVFELDKLKALPMRNRWVNGHSERPLSGDIYLTTNGYDYKPGPFKKASLYAESFVYLNNHYINFDAHSTRWDQRFHFNPYFASKPNCMLQQIGCFWKSELKTYEQIKSKKKIEYIFGMILGRKKPAPICDGDIGFMRHHIIKYGQNRSFKYYGTDWSKDDSHYGGEAYIVGTRNSPVKFNDARSLMANMKFVFAFENCHHKLYSQNYLTEKIFHAFLSHSVPIYLGCWNVEELIPGLFIDLRKFEKNVKLAMDYCEKMPDTEYNGYLERIAEFIDGRGQAFSCDERFLNLDSKLIKVFG
jgi:hypothetical protein